MRVYEFVPKDEYPNTKLIINRCLHCGEENEIYLDETSYRVWKEGILIQRAFPKLSIDHLEIIKTGTHQECWDKMLKDK